MPHEPSRWAGKGLPAAVERLMTEGARIDVAAEVGFFEVPQYPWPTEQGLAEAILECDRHLAIGATEYVPEHLIGEILETETIHQSVYVQQGADKWRAYLAVSVGTNRRAFSAPLPGDREYRMLYTLNVATPGVDASSELHTTALHFAVKVRYGH